MLKNKRRIIKLLLLLTALFVTLSFCFGCNNHVDNSTKWYSGAEDPTITLGKVGDFYFETDDCDV